MPYIEQDYRDYVDIAIDDLDKGILEACSRGASYEGALNYIVSRLIVREWHRNQRYVTANLILGALDAISKEFYLKYVYPYEIQKERQNGPIEP